MKLQLPHTLQSLTLWIVFIFGCNYNSTAQNLLNNGDFESGGSGTGFFVHDYTVINPVNGVSSPGQYGRTTNPTLFNSTFITGGDHTTGTGNMLVFDGDIAANQFFWTTSDTGGAIGGFTPGTSYVFSYWIKSVSNEVTDNSTRANIGAFFVNANNINPANLSQLAPLPEEGWVQVSYSFTATANNILVRLRTLNTGAVGNDFAVDDFSITEGSLPLEGSFTSFNPTCPDATDGGITVSLTGGFLPYGTYTLTGPVNQTSTTGIFTNLPEGTYSVSVSDANGENFTVTDIVLTAPNGLELSDPITICEGETTQLTATGGANSYTWTANPADSSITDPTAATQNVSPLVTTTYTVTSGIASSDTNLVVNGDFTQGNVGFITDYTQVDDPNPFGVQSSYDIVQNPNAWFAPFASCGDHTTGDGNMMVFDGSTDPTGTFRVWCNEETITVEPNTDYTFSYYIASVAPESPASMQVQINGVVLGPPISAPNVTCLWTLHSFQWNSGSNTTADVCIFNLVFTDFGNDFALDDISLKETVTCIYEETVTVTVTPAIDPTFNELPTSICAGDPLNALPTTSLNGYDGMWSPPLNNTETTLYTFTPEDLCVAEFELLIVVTPQVTPTFAQLPTSICDGETIAALPELSAEGITGNWTPELNNTTTTTYTFMPDGGQCASSIDLLIEVTPLETPTFDAIDPICMGATIDALPEISNEGISGEWFPELNTMETTTYEFTPNEGQCASTTELTIVVNSAFEFTIGEACGGRDYVLSAEGIESPSAMYVWFNSTDNQVGTNSSLIITQGGTYRLVVTIDGCSAEQTVTVNNPFCDVQKGISPNNDGSNDSFDLSSYNVRNLKIFNRYGTIAYNRSGYQNEWFGQSNDGNELPDGTYYYVIDFEDLETKTGWIYINRGY